MENIQLRLNLKVKKEYKNGGNKEYLQIRYSNQRCGDHSNSFKRQRTYFWRTSMPGLSDMDDWGER